MEQIILEVLSGKLDGATLLMLFILGILTKRFVPWWIHEEALEKLKEYEDAAPALLDEVSTLIDLINDDQQYTSRATTDRVQQRQERLHHAVRTRPRSVPRHRRTRKQ